MIACADKIEEVVHECHVERIAGIYFNTYSAPPSLLILAALQWVIADLVPDHLGDPLDLHRIPPLEVVRVQVGLVDGVLLVAVPFAAVAAVAAVVAVVAVAAVVSIAATAVVGLLVIATILPESESEVSL